MQINEFKHLIFKKKQFRKRYEIKFPNSNEFIEIFDDGQRLTCRIFAKHKLMLKTLIYLDKINHSRKNPSSLKCSSHNSQLNLLTVKLEQIWFQLI